MEGVAFEYEVFTILRLSREEVRRLSETCEHHYDAVVQSLSIPGPNAILNAARNEFHFGHDVADVRVSARQLDTLVKATEMPVHECLDLHLALRTIARQSTREWRRLSGSEPKDNPA